MVPSSQLRCLCAFFIKLDADAGKDARPGKGFLFFISTLNAAWADAMMQCDGKHKGQRNPIRKAQKKIEYYQNKKNTHTQEREGERKNVVYLVGGCMACI